MSSRQDVVYKHSGISILPYLRKKGTMTHGTFFLYRVLNHSTNLSHCCTASFFKLLGLNRKVLWSRMILSLGTVSKFFLKHYLSFVIATKYWNIYYLWIIALNANGLNHLYEIYDHWMHKETKLQLFLAYQKFISPLMTCVDWKWKNGIRYFGQGNIRENRSNQRYKDKLNFR